MVAGQTCYGKSTVNKKIVLALWRWRGVRRLRRGQQEGTTVSAKMMGNTIRIAVIQTAPLYASVTTGCAETF
jgi:hypothetical protein